MLAVNFINRYIYSRPDICAIFDGSGKDFTSFLEAPVYPVNEIPESTNPYTVYSWRTRSSPTHYTMNIEEITYWIWDDDVARLQRYESKLRKYLSQEDESAAAFNMWSTNQSGIGVWLHWSKYAGSSDTFIEKEEGGEIGKSMTFSVQYMECIQEQDTPLITT